MIKAFDKLDEETVIALRDVESACKSHDQLNGRVYLDTALNFDPGIKSKFLLYEDNKLVSFISLFVPTQEEAEVSAFTLPAYRRRGCFKHLLAQAVEEVRKYNIPGLLFVCEPQSKDGTEALKRLDAELDFTEYFLRCGDPSVLPDPQAAAEVRLHRAEPKDLEAMVKLNQDIFNDDYEDAKRFVSNCFEAHNRFQYIALLSEKPIGMGSVYDENGEAYIYGLGVLPSHQGKGYGRAILSLMLKDMKRSGMDNIVMEVESTNQNALSLYRKSGFEVEATFNYYRMTI